MRKILMFSVIVLCLSGLGGVADADPYRNIFLTSVDILPYHGFEVGARLSLLSADYLDSGMAGQASFRFGLLEKLELEALIPYYRFEPKYGDSISGMGKISLGATYSKIETKYVQFGFYGGVMLPTADSDFAFAESGADGLDIKLKGLICFPLGEMTSIQGNLGFIITGEGDNAFETGVNPDDIIIIDFAFNHFVLDKKLKLIVEVNGMMQNDISRQAITPAVRWEIIPAFVLEGYASVSLGSEEDRLYDTMIGIGFTYEFFRDDVRR